MNVTELTKEQLEELKHSLFYNFRYDKEQRKQIKKHLTKEDIKFLDDVNTCYWYIPDNVVFKVYDGICFVDDDFACSVED